jgi:hypothetical protein
MWSRPFDPGRVALATTGSLVVEVLALTESFREVAAAIGAYAAAWWVLGLDQRARLRVGETTR